MVRTPFGMKLWISYMILVVVPAVVIGYLSYSYLIRTGEAKARANLIVALGEINENIGFQLKDIDRSSYQVYADAKLISYLTVDSPQLEKYNLLEQYIRPQLASAVSLPNSDVNMSLYVDNESLNEIYYANSANPLLSGRQYQIMKLSRIRDLDWYRGLSLDYSDKRWTQVENDRRYGNISLLRPLLRYDSLKRVGLLRVIVDLDDLFQTLDYRKLSPSVSLVVTGAEGVPLIMSASDPALLEKALKGAGDFLVLDNDIPILGGKLTAYVPVKSLSQGATGILKLTLLVVALAVALLSFISYWISAFFSKRLGKLLSALEAFKEGHFRQRIRYSGKDEFGLIAGAFNEMTATIEDLIDRVYEQQLLKKEAELRMMQAQINPHFIYNSLNSICRLAEMNDSDRLVRMVKGLSGFYRLTLNKGEQMISISDELEQVRLYADVQKIRLSEQIDILFDIEPEALRLSTPNMILQPFVENAFNHAFYRDPITVIVKAHFQGDRIRFQIIDNGIGMSRETLDQAYALGYGIRNVDERIKLHFGSGYGVKLFSARGIGTSVVIEIPRREAE